MLPKYLLDRSEEARERERESNSIDIYVYVHDLYIWRNRANERALTPRSKSQHIVKTM